MSEADYDFDIDQTEIDLSAAANAKGSRGRGSGGAVSFIKSSKMWVGGANPTDARMPAADDPIDWKRLKQIDDERLDRNSAFLLSCANFCRSLTHIRNILQPLPNIGSRDTVKFFTLVTDAAVAVGQKKPIPTLMSLTAVNANATPIAIGQVKVQQRIKKLLLSIQHPHVLPTLDIGFVAAQPLTSSISLTANAIGTGTAANAAVGGTAAAPASGGGGSGGASGGGSGGGGNDRWNVFVVREYSDVGSLRDRLHDTQPSLLFRIKYCQSKPEAHTLTYPAKDARPLRLQYVTRFGRHILLALRYFQRIGLPYTALHSSNVIVRGGIAYLTDYENCVLGLPHRSMATLRSLYRPGVDPVLTAFAVLLYELCAGSELVPEALVGDDGTLHTALHKEYASIDSVLQRILNARSGSTDSSAAAGAVTIDSLLASPAFGGDGKTDGGGDGGGDDGTGTGSEAAQLMADSKYVKLFAPLRKMAGGTGGVSGSSNTDRKSKGSTAVSKDIAGTSVTIDIRPDSSNRKTKK